MRSKQEIRKNKENMNYLKYAFLAESVVIAVGLIFFLPTTTHNESSLMHELGPPPPWPFFIALNTLANFLRNIADVLTPPQITMLEYGFSHQKLALPYVIQKYKIADFIGNGNGPKKVDEIATYLSITNVEYLERFMYACVSLDLFKLVGPRMFVNSRLGALLKRNHPNSMAGWIGHHYEVGFKAWSNLHHMFEPNQPNNLAWNMAYPEYIFNPSQHQRGVYDMFEKSPEKEEQFGRMMEALEGVGGHAMAEDGPFERCSRFIDIGGGRGHFLTKLLKLYGKRPEMRTSILFDVPSVIKVAKKVFDSELVRKKQVTFLQGDFFNHTTIPKIEDGDCIYLRYILHDWGDLEAKEILNIVRLAIGNKKATLLIGESAMPDRDFIGTPPAVHNIDMEMLVYFGDAFERYPKYWKKLLNETRFEMTYVHPTRSILAWVEANPV